MRKIAKCCATLFVPKWACASRRNTRPTTQHSFLHTHIQRGVRTCWGVDVLWWYGCLQPYRDNCKHTHRRSRSHTHTHTHAHTHMHTHARTHTHTHAHTHMHTHAHTHMHTRTNTNTHTHAHTHMCRNMGILWWRDAIGGQHGHTQLQLCFFGGEVGAGN